MSRHVRGHGGYPPGLTLARGVEHLSGDWLVWFGRSTRHFWALSLVPYRGHHLLIEADSAEELLGRLWRHLQMQS